MKTIEERAKKFADEFATGDAALIVDIIHKVAEESYIKGATEQQEIDSVINEEELDILAKEYIYERYKGYVPITEVFKVGYRKAKGE